MFTGSSWSLATILDSQARRGNAPNALVNLSCHTRAHECMTGPKYREKPRDRGKLKAKRSVRVGEV